MTEVDHRPARLSAGLAIGAAGVAVAAVGTVAGAALATAGLVLVATGALRGRRAAVTVGALLGLAGVVAAGAVGVGPEPLLVGTAAVVLAWDLGEHAIGVGEQLGRAASTRNGELVHAANSVVVAVSGIAVGYGVFLVAAGGQPVPALVLLLAAGVLLAAALRD